MQIQPLKKEEIRKVAEIASKSFSGLADIEEAVQWVGCNFAAFPRMRYFTAKEQGMVIGYILWVEKGGFRKEAVLELEQIAVDPDFRGRGVGTELITDSLLEIRKMLKKRGALLKLVEVTTGRGNKAQRLYEKTINAKPEATIMNLFRGDEVIMLARF